MTAEATAEPLTRRGRATYTIEADRVIDARGLRGQVDWMVGQIDRYVPLAGLMGVFIDRDRDADGEATVWAPARCSPDVADLFRTVIDLGWQADRPGEACEVGFILAARGKGTADVPAWIFMSGPWHGRPHREVIGEAPPRFVAGRTRTRRQCTYKNSGEVDGEGRVVFVPARG